MLSIWSDYQVAFYDVDSMNVMWHGHYVKVIETARCHFLEMIEYDYVQMKKDGFVFPIVKMNFKYIAPTFFKDHLKIKTSLKECDTFLCFEYEIVEAKSQKRVALASTCQVAVKISDQSTQFAMPKQLLEAIKNFKETK